MQKFLICSILMIIVLVAGCGGQNPEKKINAPEEKFIALEQKFNSKIGVYVLDTNNSREICYNADERFAYCSTHKVLSVAALFQRKSIDELNAVKKISQADILTYAPVTKNHVNAEMTLAEICEAAIRWSDNTAANLIIEELGGVADFKAALREIGDNVTEPARIEPEMNFFEVGEIRDTSTPRQMAKDFKFFLIDEALSEEKKFLLKNWMTETSITDELIKAAAPADWIVADKSGSGGNFGTRNDIAVVYPPNRPPVIIAIMSRRNEVDADFDNALIVETAKIIFAELE